MGTITVEHLSYPGFVYLGKPNSMIKIVWYAESEMNFMLHIDASSVKILYFEHWWLEMGAAESFRHNVLWSKLGSL